MGKENKIDNSSNLRSSFDADLPPTVAHAPSAKQGRPRGGDLSKRLGEELPVQPSSESAELLGSPSCIFDAMDSDSIYKYLPDIFQEAIRLMPHADWAKTYPEILRDAKPTEIEFKLRLRIWSAYENFKKTGAPMVWANVYKGVCAGGYFYEYARRPVKLRFLLEPPQKYDESLASLLDIGMARLREIITMPLHNKHGVVDPNLVEKVIKCVVLVDHRIHGGYTQRAEIKAQALSAHIDINKVQSIEEIDAKIAELEKRAQGQQHNTIVIEQREPMVNILNQMTGTSADSHRDLEKLGLTKRKKGVGFGDDSAGG